MAAPAIASKDSPLNAIWQLTSPQCPAGPRHYTFAAALAGATGNYLVHFDASTQDVSWHLDVSDALLRYARWCAHAVLELDASKAPARAAHFREYIRAQPESSTSAAAQQKRSNDAYQAFVAAAKHWHRGYGALAMALHGDPYKAAHLAQLEALAVLAREAAGNAAGSAAGAALFEECYQSIRIHFAARLEQEITAAITAAHLRS
jgi:hypothetical protein